MHQVKIWSPVWAAAIFAWIGSEVILVRHRHAGILVATLIFYPLVYYATLWLPRYRLPIEPILIMITAVLLVELFNGFRRALLK